VVTPLADKLELEIWRDGEVWEQSYECGHAKANQGTGKTRKQAQDHFIPILRSSKNHNTVRILAQRLRELRFSQGLKITLADERRINLPNFDSGALRVRQALTRETVRQIPLSTWRASGTREIKSRCI